MKFAKVTNVNPKKISCHTIGCHAFFPFSKMYCVHAGDQFWRFRFLSNTENYSGKTQGTCNTNALLTNMRSRWLDIGQVLLLHFYASRSIKMQKKKPISSHLVQTSLVNKDLLYGQKIAPKNFAFVGTKQEILSRQDRPILPAQAANQNTGFASSFPLTDPAI